MPFTGPPVRRGHCLLHEENGRRFGTFRKKIISRSRRAEPKRELDRSAQRPTLEIESQRWDHQYLHTSYTNAGAPRNPATMTSYCRRLGGRLRTRDLDLSGPVPDFPNWSANGGRSVVKNQSKGSVNYSVSARLRGRLAVQKAPGLKRQRAWQFLTRSVRRWARWHPIQTQEDIKFPGYKVERHRRYNIRRS